MESPNMSHKVNVKTNEGTRQIARPRVSRYYDWIENEDENKKDIDIITDLDSNRKVSIPKSTENTSKPDVDDVLTKTNGLDVNQRVTRSQTKNV